MQWLKFISGFNEERNSKNTLVNSWLLLILSKWYRLLTLFLHTTKINSINLNWLSWVTIDTDSYSQSLRIINIYIKQLTNSNHPVLLKNTCVVSLDHWQPLTDYDHCLVSQSPWRCSTRSSSTSSSSSGGSGSSTEQQLSHLVISHRRWHSRTLSAGRPQRHWVAFQMSRCGCEGLWRHRGWLLRAGHIVIEITVRWQWCPMAIHQMTGYRGLRKNWHVSYNLEMGVGAKKY